MDHLLRAVLIWLAFMYLGAPVVIRFSQKLKARPTLQPVDPAALHPEMANYLGQVSQALAPLGFAPVGCAALHGYTSNLAAVVGLWINRAAGDRANLSAIYSTQPGSSGLRVSYLEFSTTFTNGDDIDTNNNGVRGAFRHGPENQIFRFPEVGDPQALYQLHHLILRRFARDNQKVLAVPGQEFATFEANLEKAHLRQAQHGLLYLDERAGVYRPTWKGAYLMSWPQIWPTKQILSFLARNKARELAQQLLADPVSSSVV